ncbi:MAG: hypothetical protein ACFB10_18030 [Salibacteraceae bacterium]
MVTGKKDGAEERKALFLALTGEQKKEIWGRVDDIFSANAESTKVVDENNQAQRRDIDLYWQIADQVMVEYQLGPQPKEADPDRFGIPSAKEEAMRRHQEKIKKYDGSAAVYLENHWRELTGEDAKYHFAIADELQEMPPERAQYYVAEGEKHFTYDELHPQFHSIVDEKAMDFSSVEDYAKAVERYRKTSAENFSNANIIAQNILEQFNSGGDVDNAFPLYLYVKQFDPPDYQLLTFEQRMALIHAILIEANTRKAAQLAVLQLLMTTPDGDMEALLDRVKEKEYQLYTNLNNFLEDYAAEWMTFSLKLSFQALGHEESQRQINSILQVFGKADEPHRFGNGTHLFPYASPGLFRQFADITHSYDIELKDGQVHVKVSSDYTPLELFPGLAWFDNLGQYTKSGTFKPFDIVALEVLVPDEYQSVTTMPVFMPAIALEMVEDQQWDRQLSKWIDAGVIILGVALSILAPGTGFLFVADVAFTVWSVATTLVNDFRDKIEATDWGPTFLKYWDTIDFFVNLVGMGLFIYQMPALAKSMAKMLKTALPKLKNLSKKTFDYVSDFLKQLDDDIVRAEQAGAVDEIADAATRGRQSGSTCDADIQQPNRTDQPELNNKKGEDIPDKGEPENNSFEGDETGSKANEVEGESNVTFDAKKYTNQYTTSRQRKFHEEILAKLRKGEIDESMAKNLMEYNAKNPNGVRSIENAIAQFDSGKTLTETGHFRDPNVTPNKKPDWYETASAERKAAYDNRQKLRQNLNTPDGQQAHHPTPIELLGRNKTVQDAVENGYDINKTGSNVEPYSSKNPTHDVNGNPVSQGTHASHPNYTQEVSKLHDNFRREFRGDRYKPELWLDVFNKKLSKMIDNISGPGKSTKIDDLFKEQINPKAFYRETRKLYLQALNG